VLQALTAMLIDPTGERDRGEFIAGMSVMRYRAFAEHPHGGNPAGIVLGAAGKTDAQMQHIAAAVAYAETAFVTGEDAEGFDVRYFSPVGEVPFCGHATIALGVALADERGPEDRVFRTRSGPVLIETVQSDEGALVATLTSVPPTVSIPDPGDVHAAMNILGWQKADLHPDLPPRVAYAGSHHLILVAGREERLDRLEYDYSRLKPLMDRLGWITIELVWPSAWPLEHRVRGVFPAAPVVEDPATGSAAAAYGAYLRDLGAIDPPFRLVLRQGEAMGCPSTLYVEVPMGDGGVRVSGVAIRIRAATSNAP
jgi:PhzF family phenazine biosynthesis protein